MAQETTVTISPSSWTQLTNADVTAIRVQNQSRSNAVLHLMATVGASAPSSTAGSVTLTADSILAADMTLAQVWPGVAGTRVYAYCDQSCQVSVSHA